MLWKVARFAIALESFSLSSTLALGVRLPAIFRLNNRYHNLARGSVFKNIIMGNSQSQNGDNADKDAIAATAYGSGSEIESVGDENSVASVTESDENEKEPDYTSLDIVSQLDCDMLIEQHRNYSPPSSNVTPSVHYVFLVHGWLGNDLEMSYLSEAFHKNILSEEEVSDDDDSGQNGSGSGLPATKRVKRSRSLITGALQNELLGSNEELTHPDIVVYSAKCNVGRTHDGIRNGGTRLANEIINFIQCDTKKRQEEGVVNGGGVCNVTISLVGNSLGGLYSRFALSKIPYEIPLSNESNEDGSSSKFKIRLFPNIFCTTATPHLGISQHTYLPIPRLAETIIGTGMGTTGRDLFRLNSDAMNDGAAAKVNAAAAMTVKRLGTSFRILQGSSHSIEVEHDDEDDSECVIRNMCVDNEYLVPLGNFRQRIAYANAYGTDFQVPCQTAAFLNDNSGVGHFVVGARSLEDNSDVGENVKGGAENKRSSDEEGDSEEGSIPPFIVAILKTEKQKQAQTPVRKLSRVDEASDDLLQMSQSLDALGWTKVFVDMRDSIPVPGLRKPAWMCQNSLDDLIKQRSAENNKGDKLTNRMLTSQDLSRSTATGDSFNVPLGHTVMVANSKSEVYKQMNFQGRPVMDKLAHDIVDDVFTFE